MVHIINKRGELTTQQIILLILLIASFIVILILLFRLNLNSESEAEICHNSVVVKGSSVIPADSTSLKCSRNYVCITKDGSCNDLTKPITKKVSSEEEVYSVLADLMAECWWMFGEGKIDYLGDKALKNNYCSICSQIAFDDSLLEIEKFSKGNISKDILYSYLAVEEYSEGQTYAQYFFKTNDIEALKQQISGLDNNNLSVGTFGNIEIGKQYYVMMGITSEIGNTYKWIGAGLASLALVTPVGWVGGAIIIGTGVGVGAGGGTVADLFDPEIGAIIVEGDGIDNAFMAPTIQEVNQDRYESLNCKDVLTLS